MSFQTYAQGLKLASDLANKAVAAESSLSSLSPLTSPLPTLSKAFPLYISAAEAYSHLLSSHLVPETERAGIKKKWRLVLERAEKVKGRIEALGGQVGRANIGDEGVEDSIRRRGGSLNEITAPLWREPSDWEFQLGKEGAFRDGSQPQLDKGQLALDPEWAEVLPEAWIDLGNQDPRWILRQGPGADCSIVAGMGVCVEHNRRWKTTLGMKSLYPQASSGQPHHSENGKHIVKLLLNGAWRSMIIDSLLPRSRLTHAALHVTSQSTSSAGKSPAGPSWLPLATKAYFKAHGGYELRGSNPAPDIYTFTGWIPERVGLREGFQREKEWRRVYEAWKVGRVLVTLGTGEIAPDELVSLHAYGVLGFREEGEERILEIFDPGSSRQMADADGVTNSINQLNINSPAIVGGCAIFTKTWEEVCSEFETLNLNWDPALVPTTIVRHWSWPKPSTVPDSSSDGVSVSSPRYHLTVDCPSKALPEVWLLLSQHMTSKDRPLDDIALHFFEEHGANDAGQMGKALLEPQRAEHMSPYTNSPHVLVRYQLRRPQTTLLLLPARDRGYFATDFTLQALAPTDTTLSLERISRSLPFQQTMSSALTNRNAGGHTGWPSWMSNPQYRLVVSPQTGPGRKVDSELRMLLHGAKELAWNVKVLWGRGELVYEASEDSIVGDSGPYGFGMAFLDVPDIQPGTYTVVISSFEPRQTGPYSLSIESSSPIKIESIPQEGAGMYNRTLTSSFTPLTAAGRPSLGQYNQNGKVEIILPKPTTLIARLILPNPPHPPIPINLTIFKRGENGSLGELVATTGPYAEGVSGVVWKSKIKLEAGVYLGLVSAWDAGMGIGVRWEVRIWGDSSFSAEVVR